MVSRYGVITLVQAETKKNLRSLDDLAVRTILTKIRVLQPIWKSNSRRTSSRVGSEDEDLHELSISATLCFESTNQVRTSVS